MERVQKLREEIHKARRDYSDYCREAHEDFDKITDIKQLRREACKLLNLNQDLVRENEMHCMGYNSCMLQMYTSSDILSKAREESAKYKKQIEELEKQIKELKKQK